jgi:hypothetical protein
MDDHEQDEQKGPVLVTFASLSRWIRYRWPIFMSLWDIAVFIVVSWVLWWWMSIALDTSISLEEKRILLVGFGGLILSILTLYITTLRPFLRKPRLSLCLEHQWSEPHVENDTGSWFYRCRIENYGLAVAEDCVGRLIGVWTADGKKIKKFDPLFLYWSRQGKIAENNREIITFEPITIQGFGDFYYLDLATLKKETLTLRVVIHPPMTLSKAPDTSPSPSIEPVLKLPGTYYICVGVYSKNAYIQPFYLKIHCSEIQQPLDSINSPCKIQRVRNLPSITPDRNG